jgi:hypothetical protein
VQNINLKYILDYQTYGLNEFILSDLFSLIYVKILVVNIQRHNNAINIEDMDRFNEYFPECIKLNTKQYLFKYDSVYIKILMLNKFNIFVGIYFSNGLQYNKI